MTLTSNHPALRPVLTLSAAFALVMSMALLAAPVSADPPGNNGTVKIDGIDFDEHPDNEPHPGCIFQVDFYGYDAGDLHASVRFEAWPPTGEGQADLLLEEERIFIGEDDHSGGGSEAGLDAARTYDLSEALAGREPHPNQGHHVKLTVHADGSQGADTKHKVFWVECEVAAAAPTPIPAEEESPAEETASPPQRGGQLGGTPTPAGGRLPDTAAHPISSPLPAAVLALMALFSLSLLASAHVMEAERRR